MRAIIEFKNDFYEVLKSKNCAIAFKGYEDSIINRINQAIDIFTMIEGHRPDMIELTVAQYYTVIEELKELNLSYESKSNMVIFQEEFNTLPSVEGDEIEYLYNEEYRNSLDVKDYIKAMDYKKH